jgi:hypothetical protein
MREAWRAGTYAGASAVVAVGGGIGANVLVGGSNHTIELQPFTVQQQTGTTSQQASPQSSCILWADAAWSETCADRRRKQDRRPRLPGGDAQSKGSCAGARTSATGGPLGSRPANARRRKFDSKPRVDAHLNERRCG